MRPRSALATLLALLGLGVLVNEEEMAEEADEMAAPTPPTLMLARRALGKALSRCKDQDIQETT
jgi:hypothetical protein